MEMEFSAGVLFGQIVGLLVLALVIYLLVLIPMSLRKITGQLSEIKEELRKRNDQAASNREP